MRIHRDERGQTIILVALSLPLILGFVGLATDVGSLFKDKRTMQTAADAAAIAAALNLNAGTYDSAGKASAATNGYPVGKGVTVTVSDPPTWASSNYYNKPGYVEVTITKSEPTIFLALFGHPSVTVLARAVATNTGPSGVCVFAGIGSSPPTGTPLTVNSSMQAGQCGVAVDTINSPPIAGNGSLTATSVGVVGDCSSGCEPTINPTPVSNIVPYADPLVNLPQPTCNGTASCTLDGTTYPCLPDPIITSNNPPPLLQGCYNGLTVNGANNVTFNPGTYVINGPLTFNASNISGAGVVFYVNSGPVSIGGNSRLNLSAPVSGTFTGILFAQSPLSPNPAIINGLATSTIEGFFYFPAASLTIDGNFPDGTIYTGFVANSLSINTTGLLSFTNYATLPGVTSPIPSAVLVE